MSWNLFKTRYDKSGILIPKEISIALESIFSIS
jgi:hypothetical protein